MILYLVLFIFLLVIIFFLYIRLKYKFWSIQPVFHFYDFHYWFRNVGIIRHELPEKNKYTNFKNIETIPFDKLLDIKKNANNTKISDFVHLIRNYYLNNKTNKYNPSKDNITPDFHGHNSDSYWSFYWEPILLLNSKTNTTIEDKKLISVVTSRPLHVQIITKNNSNGVGIDIHSFDLFYVDYLCVDKTYRKKNIAPQMIQTHEYNQCHLSEYKGLNMCVSLFKREEELTGIIPLTHYNTYCFNMDKWSRPEVLGANITFLVGDAQNMYYLYNFIKEETERKKWDITIIPSMSNIIELVNTNNIYIIMTLINGDIKSAYIFKKTCTFLDKDKEVISCIASIKGTSKSPKAKDILSDEEFIQGFKIALWSIIKDRPTYKFCSIENISDNQMIINNIHIKTHPYIVSQTAYFFYNFAYNPFKSNRCLILN